MKNVEILAPVGNYEMLNTAIANKANAVYLGLENFNARAKADNFNSDNIREVIKLCHLFGIKVYITVNTLISNSEMSSVVTMIEKAHKSKADAFIVQDLGLAYILKQTFPNIELHASTQMGVCNVKGAKVLEKLGFSRVVVARETTLEDIKQIKKQTNLEIEAFVQGALCVCYSGSCYISSLLKNKSGNRGECLQLCRLPYKLVENGQIKKQGYLLSTRDISLISKVHDMIDAGVSSFKIEGRLRRPAYLAQSLISVRNAIENNSSIEDEDFKLKKVFSRGEFNKGIYFNSKSSGGIINSDINNHLGIKIGTVLKVNTFKDIYKITLDTNHEICSGDGLKFINKNNQLSMGVGSVNKLNKTTYEVYGKIKPVVGSIVYLTVDSKSEHALLKNTNKLKINAKVKAIKNQNLEIVLYNENLGYKYVGQSLEQAKNQAVTKDDFIKCIKKTGNEYLEIVDVDVTTDEVFIAKSQLNNARREAIDRFIDYVVFEYESKNSKEFLKINYKNKKINQNNINFNYYIIDKIEKLQNIKIGNSKIIYAPNFYDCADIKSFSKKVLEKYNTKMLLYLPVVANYRDLNKIDEILNILNPRDVGIVAGSLYGLYYIDCGYEVVPMINTNIANDYTVKLLNLIGCENYISSVENYLFDNVDSCHKYVGNCPLMTLVMCPFIEHCSSNCKNCKYNSNYKLIMQDGTEFNIRRIKMNDCYFELYQNKKITIPSGYGYLIDLRD